MTPLQNESFPDAHPPSPYEGWGAAEVDVFQLQQGCQLCRFSPMTRYRNVHNPLYVSNLEIIGDRLKVCR